MTGLSFACTGVAPERYAAAPTLVFDLRVTEESGERVHALALRCQIRIEPQRRTYEAAEAEGLLDLFGEPARWGDTLKPLQFTTVPLMVPGFSGETEVGLPVPVTYDLEVAAGKYFQALRDGEVPLLLLFSGTVFYQGAAGLQVEQVPWDREARYRLPVAVWRELIDLRFPNSGWLRLSRDTLDTLHRVKARRALPTWEHAIEYLLKQAGEEMP
ncbi:hypothetical protein C3Y87_18460 [Carbonactinospora thermoautotrophica]|uniref:DUF6084 family protein n=1 Tax=Carbonactinospora thermoautotrophica TaxID=1469144 RepID=UPI00226DE2DA|nr:DUF6084 family protein [Carbonactinospora thermoautotrophica]MCX9193349.1 hypothetical protein [Carbonactinospora thermoautotrophica]